MVARMDKQRSIRLPTSLWARIEDWSQAVAAEARGDEPKVSDAIRRLLILALDGEDRRRARKPKASTTEGGET